MKEKAKRPYKKPQVFEVKLTPEEAVLTGCKGDTGGAPKKSIPYKCVSACASTIGS